MTSRPKHPFNDARARRRYEAHDELHVEFRHRGLSEVPEWLFDRDLQILGLAFNELTSLPDSLELVAGSLRELDLRHNPLASLPEVVRTLRCLEKLYLCHTHITWLPDWLGTLPALVYVQVEGLVLEPRPAKGRFRLWP